jgi:hypothetical protein
MQRDLRYLRPFRDLPQEIHLYAMCHNEAKMLPFFFRHYTGLVDKFFIFDNGSTDGSLELLAGDERVKINEFIINGDSFVDEARILCDRHWKNSRIEAHWAIIVEVDEHLFHPDLISYLKDCSAKGITAIKALGYDMVCEAFPTDGWRLSDKVTSGFRARWMDKLAIIDPNAIEETNFEVGRHAARPTGRVVPEDRRQVTLLHYKSLGSDYVNQRNQILAKGLRPRDLSNNWGFHYLKTADAVVAEIEDRLATARRVPGLSAGNACKRLSLDEEVCIIRASGLFQVAWYLKNQPDVAAHEIDPLEHFCLYGWREGRRPNPYFDPKWYVLTYPPSDPTYANPLLDYIVSGERAGRRPTIDFDPIAYSSQHKLAFGESALLDLLRRREPIQGSIAG